MIASPLVWRLISSITYCGLAVGESSRYLNGYRFFHALICAHHAWRSRCSMQRQHRFQRCLGIADHRHIHVHVLADAAGVDVDVDDLGVGGERREVAGHAVVEAGADGDEAIAFLHGIVGEGRCRACRACSSALGSVHQTRPGPAGWWCRGYFPFRPACARLPMRR